MKYAIYLNMALGAYLGGVLGFSGLYAWSWQFWAVLLPTFILINFYTSKAERAYYEDTQN